MTAVCSVEGRFGGGASDGSSLRILIMLDRLAGVGLGGSTGGAGVMLGRGGSRVIWTGCGGRDTGGDCAGD